MKKVIYTCDCCGKEVESAERVLLHIGRENLKQRSTTRAELPVSRNVCQECAEHVSLLLRHPKK